MHQPREKGKKESPGHNQRPVQPKEKGKREKTFFIGLLIARGFFSFFFGSNFSPVKLGKPTSSFRLNRKSPTTSIEEEKINVFCVIKRIFIYDSRQWMIRKELLDTPRDPSFLPDSRFPRLSFLFPRNTFLPAPFLPLSLLASSLMRHSAYCILYYYLRHTRERPHHRSRIGRIEDREDGDFRRAHQEKVRSKFDHC